MKRFIFTFLIIPTICFSQFKEVVQPTNGRIGQFYDEENKAPFSLTKKGSYYELCFFNKAVTNSDAQMKCLPFNETENSMLDFYNYGAELFDSAEMLSNKYLETGQYRITISKSGNFINLEIFDKNSGINNLSVSSLISKMNWKKLFGKN